MSTPTTAARTPPREATELISKAAGGEPPTVDEAKSIPPELDSQAVKDQLAETREEISRVDSKASIVLAGAGVAIGVVIAGLLAGHLQVGQLPTIVVILAGGAAAAALAGIAFLGAAIYPHCGTAEAGRARYFAEVATHDTHEELRAALGRDAAAGDRLLHQLLGLSKGVASKYKRLRSGIRVLGIAIALATGAGILNLLIG